MAFCLLLSSRKQPGHSLQRRARAHPAARARMRASAGAAAGGSSRSVPPPLTYRRRSSLAPSRSALVYSRVHVFRATLVRSMKLLPVQH